MPAVPSCLFHILGFSCVARCCRIVRSLRYKIRCSSKHLVFNINSYSIAMRVGNTGTRGPPLGSDGLIFASIDRHLNSLLDQWRMHICQSRPERLIRSLDSAEDLNSTSYLISSTIHSRPMKNPLGSPKIGNASLCSST